MTNDGRPKPDLNLAEVLNNIEASGKDQTSSRFLQMTLKEQKPEEISAIFNAVLPVVQKLSIDQFGNFVVQILLEQASETSQREQMAEKLKTEAVELANDKFGCRVIQKALDVMNPELQMRVIADIKDTVLNCIKSMHGNHVIQQCVQKMPIESLDWILEVVEKETEFVASHMYGCRVFQRLCERCEKHQIAAILDKTVGLVGKLARDPHGNYVVQCVLEHGRLEDKKRILQAVQDNVIDFAQNKCSSNVVERCMETASTGKDSGELEGAREAFLRALIGQPGDPKAPLRLLMTDKFGNFIVQRMIKHSKGDDRELLKAELKKEEATLESSNQGKHILATMKKEFGE